ncbi:Trypanosomal VSG domain [Trypanosoma vivax]|nr:Trypanosomal VSG domain [Trypanosoma vivax]
MRDSHASTGHRGGANTEGAGDFGEAVGGKQERRDRENRRALAAVAVNNVTRSKVGENEERENATLLAAKMLDAGAWDTRWRTQWHSPCKPLRNGNRSRRSWTGKKSGQQGAVRSYKRNGRQYKHFKRKHGKLGNTGYTSDAGHRHETGGGREFTKHSGKALAADITCLCPSEGQHNECIKIQSGGKLIESKVKDVKTAVSHWNAMKNYCIARARSSNARLILASIAQLKAMLGTNTKSETTGEHIPHITHAPRTTSTAY